jgi:hypothetical protein
VFCLLDGKWLSFEQCKLVFENETVRLQSLKLKMVFSNTSIVWNYIHLCGALSFEGFLVFQFAIFVIYLDSWFTYDFV